MHVDHTAVVSKFERAVEKFANTSVIQNQDSWMRLGTEKSSGSGGRTTVVSVVLFSHTSRSALYSRQCDRRHAHAPSSSVAQFSGSLCKATVNKPMKTTSSGELYRDLCAGADAEDVLDHDMRLDAEIPGPAAAAEVPRVEIPAAVAPELSARLQSKIGRNVATKRHTSNDPFPGETFQTSSLREVRGSSDATRGGIVRGPTW